ncbi:MarR family winged helix-turn-helix transcriptional regulator [Geodermatophilus sp. SYSU D00815]
MDADTRGLALGLRDLLRVTRLMKQRRPGAGSVLPAGLLPILTHVDEFADGCHARELAARTALDPSTVSRAVAQLVGNGLVERRADPSDGRASVLVLTDAGRSALADANRWYGELLDRALAGWTPAEIGALVAALDRFTRDVDRSLTAHDTTLEAAR